MIVLTCSACQKKLSAKETLVGKKVQCPGCGAVMVVAIPVAVGNAATEEVRVAPPAPADASDQPTRSLQSTPDVTVAKNGDEGRRSNLTDFLAPPQSGDELGRLGEYRIL